MILSALRSKEWLEYCKKRYKTLPIRKSTTFHLKLFNNISRPPKRRLPTINKQDWKKLLPMSTIWSVKDVRGSFLRSKLAFWLLKKRTKDSKYGQRQRSVIMMNITQIKKNCKLLPNISKEKFKQKLLKCTASSKRILNSSRRLLRKTSNKRFWQRPKLYMKKTW